jgi:hypothetical protein
MGRRKSKVEMDLTTCNAVEPLTRSSESEPLTLKNDYLRSLLKLIRVLARNWMGATDDGKAASGTARCFYCAVYTAMPRLTLLQDHIISDCYVV